MSRTITPERIDDFRHSLQQRGCSSETVDKYVRDVAKLADYLHGREVTQKNLEAYKTWLMDDQKYKKSSINAFIISAMSFCKSMNWLDTRISTVALDYKSKSETDKYITRAQYQQVVTTAEKIKDYRMMMLIQTLCHMDIRYSEIQAVTVGALAAGTVQLTRRNRKICYAIPEYLRTSLQAYARRQNITEGIIFCTSRGTPINRSNLWRGLKELCETAGVDSRKMTLQKLKMPVVQDYYPFYSLSDEGSG